MGIGGRRIDLHGLYPDQVDFVLSPVLEAAFRAGQTEITIIHGKGEGVLRQAVQQVLSRQRHLILSVERGEEVLEGGEGWMRVSLKYKEINRSSPHTKYTKSSLLAKKATALTLPDFSKVLEKRERGKEKYLRRVKKEKR